MNVTRIHCIVTRIHCCQDTFACGCNKHHVILNESGPHSFSANVASKALSYNTCWCYVGRRTHGGAMWGGEHMVVLCGEENTCWCYVGRRTHGGAMWGGEHMVVLCGEENTCWCYVGRRTHGGAMWGGEHMRGAMWGGEHMLVLCGEENTCWCYVGRRTHGGAMWGGEHMVVLCGEENTWWCYVGRTHGGAMWGGEHMLVLCEEENTYWCSTINDHKQEFAFGWTCPPKKAVDDYNLSVGQSDGLCTPFPAVVTQRKLPSTFDDLHYKTLFQLTPYPIDRARLTAVSAPHASAWLSV